MLKTKIEVLIDKMELVLEEAGNQLTDVDKRLIRRYASQIVEAVGKELPFSHNSTITDTKTEQKNREGKEAVPQPDVQKSQSVLEKMTEKEALKEGKTERKMQETNETHSIKEDKEGEVFGFLHPWDDEKEKLEKSEAAYKDISQSLEAIKKANKKKMALLEEEEEEEKEIEPDDASLNDRFKKEESVLIDRLKDKPIDSLQLEIDLNEKFWFINELFNGDSAAFNQLLKALDEAGGVQSAREILQNTLKDIPVESIAVKKLKKLIERRFLQ